MSHLSDVANLFLDAACDSLSTTVAGVPEHCFLAHDQPPDDCCDFLAVYAEFIRPIQGFENAQYISGVKIPARCGDITNVVDLVIRLVRPCYPTLKDNATNPFPPPGEIHVASESLLDDAWALWCGMKQAHCEGRLAPEGACLEVAWGDMTPHGPKGGCAGWTWRITAELDQCGFGEEVSL